MVEYDARVAAPDCPRRQKKSGHQARCICAIFHDCEELEAAIHGRTFQ
ncbi:MAG TPA: hypothetical protein VGH81_06045 [Rudaea sp.]